MSENSTRYQRQQQVAQLSGSAQQALAEAHVLIIGAGGLGSPSSLFLTGAGVGEITLVDHDIVSLTNLHRQILFQESDIQSSKAEAAKARLSALNSEIKINALNARLCVSNVEELVSKATIVIDAADSFFVSYLLSDTCAKQAKPLVTASVLTTHGYLGVFCGGTAPSLRAVFPSPSSEAASCDTAGVTGPSVGIIASYQAQEALKVIVNDQTQLSGKLMYLDLWDYSQNIIDFNGALEPKIKAEIIEFASIDESDVLLDVRSESEFVEHPSSQHSKASKSMNIALDKLSEQQTVLSNKQRIVCVCKSGQRALNAAHWLLSKGFSKVAVSLQPF